MIRLNLLVTKDIYEWVRKQAFKYKISMAEFVRRVLLKEKRS